MEEFLKYLINLKIGKASLKNYKSDINHFTSWMIMKVRSFGSFIESLDESVAFLNPQTAMEYKTYLVENKIPLKTINRRLSSLRHLAKYLHTSGKCDFNFMNGIENKKYLNTSKDISLQPIVNEFKAYLISKKVSQSTVKNYLSDINQFVSWLEKNPTYAQTS